MEGKTRRTPAENVAFMLDYETGYLRSALDTLELAEELIESQLGGVAAYDKVRANRLGQGVSALYMVERHLTGFWERADRALRDFEFGYSPNSAGCCEDAAR